MINNLDILTTANTLRPGHIASTPTLDIKDLPCGDHNLHIIIEYEDGVRYIARIRQPRILRHPFPFELASVKAEIATQRWLSESGAAPVPKVLSPIYGQDQMIYYFMELITGSPCKDSIYRDDFSRSHISQVIKDYAKVNIRRSQHPLRLNGSLHHDPATDTFTVGPLSTTAVKVDGDAPVFPGPWRTASERYIWDLDFDLDLIRTGEFYKNQRDKAYLVWRWMRRFVPKYPPYLLEEDTFVIHEDSHGGHIMINEEGNITGLIDWDMASVGPECEAFSTPVAFRDKGFYRGSNELSWLEVELSVTYHDLGRPDIAECIKLGRPFQWVNVLTRDQGSWEHYPIIKALGEALGLVMKDNVDDFLAEQRERFKVGYERLMKQWDKEKAEVARKQRRRKRPATAGLKVASIETGLEKAIGEMDLGAEGIDYGEGTQESETCSQ